MTKHYALVVAFFNIAKLPNNHYQCFFKVRLEEPLNNFERPQIFTQIYNWNCGQQLFQYTFIISKLEFIPKTSVSNSFNEPTPLDHRQRLRWGIFPKIKMSKITFSNVGLLCY